MHEHIEGNGIRANGGLRDEPSEEWTIRVNNWCLYTYAIHMCDEYVDYAMFVVIFSHIGLY